MSENVSSSSFSLRKAVTGSNRNANAVPMRRYLGKPWERLVDVLADGDTEDEEEKDEQGWLTSSSTARCNIDRFFFF